MQRGFAAHCEEPRHRQRGGAADHLVVDVLARRHDEHADAHQDLRVASVEVPDRESRVSVGGGNFSLVRRAAVMLAREGVEWRGARYSLAALRAGMRFTLESWRADASVPVVRMLSRSVTFAWRGTLILGALIASCSPFAGGSAGENDSGAAADASATDALGVSDEGARDGAVAFPDATTRDAPPPPPDAGFCSATPGAIQCFDFDESNPVVGLVLAQGGGTVSFQGTFAGGSAPMAMVVEPKVTGGNVVAKAGQIDLTAHKNKTVSVDFRFQVVALPTGTEYIARLNDVASFISIDATGIHCGAGVAAAAFVAGVHKVSITMLVNANGVVNSLSCAVDMTTAVTSSTAASTTLSLEIGNVTSTSGNFRVAYDDVLVRAQ
jgi:hypothetical protein